MSTKEQIAKAASVRFKRREFEIEKGVTVTLRELSKAEYDKLHGETHEGETGKQTIKQDGLYAPRWIAACIEGHIFTPEEVKLWTESLQEELLNICYDLNGIKITTEQIAKN